MPVILQEMHVNGAVLKSEMKFIMLRYELTGNELIALILESQEIRRLWPKYNQAQKFRVEEWGIFDYEDRNGYLRFSVNIVTKRIKTIDSFQYERRSLEFSVGEST